MMNKWTVSFIQYNMWKWSFVNILILINPFMIHYSCSTEETVLEILKERSRISGKSRRNISSLLIIINGPWTNHCREDGTVATHLQSVRIITWVIFINPIETSIFCYIATTLMCLLTTNYYHQRGWISTIFTWNFEANASEFWEIQYIFLSNTVSNRR